MKSIIVHYSGNRAQGQQPPVVRRAAGAQPARGDGGPRRARGARAAWAGSKSCSATERDWAGGARPPRAGVRRRPTSRRRGARRSTSTRSRRADPARSRRARGSATFRVSARRADKRFPADLAADRARGRRPDQGGARLARRSRRAGVHDPRRGAHARGVLLLRQGARRRRHAGRRQRARGVPAVGRHRLAGRGVAADAARLPRAVRALPQLPDPVARVAGEGARAGAAAGASSSSTRGCSWCRSARSSSRSCWPSRRRCASSSTGG